MTRKKASIFKKRPKEKATLHAYQVLINHQQILLDHQKMRGEIPHMDDEWMMQFLCDFINSEGLVDRLTAYSKKLAKKQADDDRDYREYQAVTGGFIK